MSVIIEHNIYNNIYKLFSRYTLTQKLVCLNKILRYVANLSSLNTVGHI